MTYFSGFRISEYDGVLVPAPVAVDFPAFSVLDVEGVPFSSVGEETMQDWEAFARCLQDYAGPKPEIGFAGYIVNAAGLVACMQAKGLPPMSELTDREFLAVYGEALKQCGLEHPEYVTDWAKTIPPTEQVYIDYWYLETHPDAAVCKTYVYDNFDEHVDAIPTYDRTGLVTRTWKKTWWEMQSASLVDYCKSALAPYSGLVATLARPIEMSVMRGVTLTCKFKTSPPSPACFLGYLWYKPQEATPMPPPGFRGGYYNYPPVDQATSVPILTCFGGGYYYERVYDGKFQLQHFITPGIDGTILGEFKIKNLIKVTGTGTVTP